ncbi:hypothetical protein Tco_1009526 [Tanacetum coccineum]
MLTWRKRMIRRMMVMGIFFICGILRSRTLNELAPATKSILDELLEEFGDEIMNVTMVDEEVDSNPTRDIEELERLLAKDPQSHFTEIQGFNSKGMEFESFLPDHNVMPPSGGEPLGILNKLKKASPNQTSLDATIGGW